MITHFVNEKYRITSENIDSCLPAWSNTLGAIGIFELIIGVVGFAVYHSYYPITDWSLVAYFGVVCEIGTIISACVILMFASEFYIRCGIFVKLEIYGKYRKDEWTRITGYQFQMSGDPDRDATKLQSKIDEYKKIIELKMNTHNKLKEKKDYEKKISCNQYKAVIERVKK